MSNLQKQVLGQIKIVNDIRFIETVLGCIRSLAANYNLPNNEINRLTLATEDAIGNVLTWGYKKDEKAFYEVEVNITNMDFNIVIRDTGMPFDFAKMNFDENHLEGMGVHLMYQLVDHVDFVLSSKGREQRLVKHLQKLPVYERSLAVYEDALVDENISFDFHKIRKEESLAVAQCVYDEYGYTYPYEMVYYPELFFKACENNEVYSLVATAPNGEVAGHLALTMNVNLPGIAEMGIGVVRQKYRKFHIMKILTEKIIDIAKNVLHLNGMFAQPVAYHTITQHISNKIGLLPCGFALAYTSDDFASHINNSVSRRSVAVCMLPFSKEKKDYYIHKDLKKLSEIIFKEEYYNRKEAKEIPELPQKSISKLSINDVLKLAKIFVDVAGEDWESTLRNYILSIKRSNSKVIEIYINIVHPSAIFAYDVAKKFNFFATGILPLSDNGDYLTAECLMNEVVDYDALKTIEPYTSILKIVRSLDPNE